MSSIFRHRNSDEFTIDELKNCYLWFSKPSGFRGDQEDANVLYFTKKNETIEDALKKRFQDYFQLLEFTKNIGICCFTNELKEFKFWYQFPAGKKGIVVEYDKEKLEEHFAQALGLGDCFKAIDYLEDPSITKADNLSEIIKDPKLLDNFFLKMYTRLSKRHNNQNESRIVVSENHAQFIDEINDEGYKVNIPGDTIIRIYISKKTDLIFLSEIGKLGIEIKHIDQPELN